MIELVWLADKVADEDLSSRIGNKAAGLTCIPSAWRPPAFVIDSCHYIEWREASEVRQVELVKEVSEAIIFNSKKFDAVWTAGLILRSSATSETLANRGAYISRSLPADFNSASICSCIYDIFDNFFQKGEAGAIAIIVQPLIPGPSRFVGHMSNERRVSKTINHWMFETVDGQGDRFNAQRAKQPPISSKLTAKNAKAIIEVFRSVGRWATTLNRGPAHIEWGWSNDVVWLLQIDFEDEAPDLGVDPRVLVRSVDTDEVDAEGVSPFAVIDENTPRLGWKKVDNVRHLRSVRKMPFPKLYLLRGSDLSGDEADLESIIRRTTLGRAVCRTDCTEGVVSGLNLPRTHSVSPRDALGFMKSTNDILKRRGASEADICFILHRFIPAKCSAWSLADPDSQFVRIDALWGIPDGLQFLPHDTYEYDLKRKRISAETLRYKVAFIQEHEDGSWRKQDVIRRLARSRTLSVADVSEIARQTHALAKIAGKKIQVMWFCDIPESVAIGRNLPWFQMSAPEVEGAVFSAIAPTRRRFMIESVSDLEKAKSLSPDQCVITLNPDVEIIRRDDEFLVEVAKIARQIRAPVELFGSILGHAYYLLQNSGVTVIAAGEPAYKRTRGKQVFAKLVRDNIPAQIEEGGELVTLAEIAKQDARKALVSKLYEEGHEVLSAISPEEVQAELADIVEVARSLAAATGVSWEDVLTEAEAKREKRGGFETHTVLMQTSWPKSSRGKESHKKIIPLNALSEKIQSDDRVEINYPAIFSSGTHRVIDLSEGKYKVELSGQGVRLIRVSGRASKAQGDLPGLGDGSEDS